MKQAIRRWVDLFLLAVIAWAVLVLLSPVLVAWGENLFNRYGFGPWPFAILLVVIGLVGALGIWPIVEAGGFRFRHLHPIRFLRFPPFWIAAVLAIAIYIKVEATWGSLWKHAASPTLNEALWTTSPIPAALLLGWCFAWLAHTPRDSRKGIAGDPARRSGSGVEISGTPREVLDNLTGDPGVLRRWLAIETPINGPESDWFGMRHKARQMASVLNDQPGDTFGLIGGFGSGKTSFLNLVEHYTKQTDKKNPPELIWVRVGQWGLSDVSAAEYALRRGIAALAERVDCLALAAVPRHYAAAIEQAKAPWWISWLAWSSQQHDPVEELARVNEVVEAIGAHLVFCIEDADRNAHPEDLRHQYVQLQAMLDRLRGCRRLTFILTASHAAFDFSRLCKHKFNVPHARYGFVGALIQALRYELIRDMTTLDRDIEPSRSPAAIAELSRRLPATLPVEMLVMDGMQRDYSLPWEDICQLLERPRRLKEALDATRQIWKELRGEVDFDDLLVCQTIRAASPSAFDFLQARSTLMSAHHLESDVISSKVADRWSKQVRDNDFERHGDKAAVSRLIGWLFGTCPDQQKPPWTPDGDKRSPQRVRDDNDVYWQRIWEERVDDSARPRDQEVLRLTLRWSRDQDPEMVRQLVEVARFAEVFNELQKDRKRLRKELTLDGTELLQLQGAVNNQILSRHGADSSTSLSVAPFTCWFLAYERGFGDPDTLINWLRAEIGNALPVSLRMSMDILYRLADVKEHRVSKEQYSAIRKWINEDSKGKWSGAPDNFVKVLSVASEPHAYALHDLVVHAGREAYDPLTLTDWRWLVPVVTSALTSAPFVVVPHAVALISEIYRVHSRDEFGHPATSSEVRVDRKRVCELMPNHKEREQFIRALHEAARSVDDSDWPSEVVVMVDTIKGELETWITKGVRCPQDKPTGGATSS